MFLTLRCIKSIIEIEKNFSNISSLIYRMSVNISHVQELQKTQSYFNIFAFKIEVDLYVKKSSILLSYHIYIALYWVESIVNYKYKEIDGCILEIVYILCHRILNTLKSLLNHCSEMLVVGICCTSITQGCTRDLPSIGNTNQNKIRQPCKA